MANKVTLKDFTEELERRKNEEYEKEVAEYKAKKRAYVYAHTELSKEEVESMSEKVLNVLYSKLSDSDCVRVNGTQTISDVLRWNH